MVLTKLCNTFLLTGEILCTDDFFHPPFIAGCSGKHTAHQMIMSVRMCKGMQRIVLVYTKFLTGNKYRTTGSQRDRTLTITDCTCTDCTGGIVTCTGSNLYSILHTELFGQLRF